MDAVADVTAVCMLLHRIGAEKIVASPVHVGCGKVRCAHGVLPVPAPATAHILRGVPTYGGRIEGELCTPTGAALLKHFVSAFAGMPVMSVDRIGYGMGKKDFKAANCVRAMLGESVADSAQTAVQTPAQEIDREQLVQRTVPELSCNVDDMSAEAIAYACEQLFAHGAHEVYTVPIGMKKSRPGTLIRVICAEKDRDEMVRLLFRYTTTIGVRETLTRRYVLHREIVTLDTPYGPVRRKDVSGYGVTRSKYEYDDLSRIAAERGVSVEEVRRELVKRES